MAIPLAKKLKKRIHRNVALCQDLIVVEVYNFFPHAVLHGGTAIWRCYRGNRFSEDLDFYLRSVDEHMLQKFVERLRIRGVFKQKVKRTQTTVFAKFSFIDAVVRFEAGLRTVRGHVVKPFEMYDGSYMLVRTLEPKDILLEKVSAYLARRKIRDLYDIYFLLQTQDITEEAREPLKTLLTCFREPEDVNVLKSIIISGTVPSVRDMLRVVGEWVKKFT